ncbi:MAG: hypothetical protein D6734_04235 [Candidatus Schekmanbacteria bacterium]|nr:MAG: hypothetical protein D6734_04235 [Candidatus Schekmanbacteria bacterium]
MNYLKLLLLLFFTYIVQSLGWNNLYGSEVIPDFLLLVLILIQQWLNWKEGLFFGLTAGITADVFSSGNVGIFSISYLLAAFIIQSIKEYIEIESIVFQSLYLTIFTFSTLWTNFIYLGYLRKFESDTILFFLESFGLQLLLNFFFFIIVKLFLTFIMERALFESRRRRTL